MAKARRIEAENRPMPAERIFPPRWLLLVLAILLVIGTMAAIAGDQSGAVFGTAIYFVFTAPLIFTAWMLGLRITQPFAGRGCFEGSPRPEIYRTLVAIALGLGTFALATLFLGAAHLVEPGGQPYPLLAIPLAGVLIGWTPTREFFRRFNRAFFLRQAHRGDWLYLLSVAPIAVLLIAATFPPGTLWSSEGNGYDVLEYHLQLPREYALNNSIAPLHHNVYSFFPQNVEMLYLILMQAAKSVMGADRETGYLWATFPAQLLHAVMTLMTAAAIALMPIGADNKAHPWLMATGRAFAAMTFLAIPWTIVTGSLAYNEAGMMFFGTLALGLTLSGKSSTLSVAILVGLLLGLAVGCKMTAGVFFALPVALIMVIRAAGDRGHMKALALTAGIAVAVYSPWAIRAAIGSGGNPVFPLATSLLPRDGWTEQETLRFDRGHSALPAQQSTSARFQALIDQSILDAQWSIQPSALMHIADDAPMIAGSWWQRIGLLWLAMPLAIVCALVARTGRAEVWMLLAIVAAQTAAWLFATHLQARFLLPVAVPLALLAGRGVQGLHIQAGAQGAGIVAAACRILAGTLLGLGALASVFLLLPEAHLLGGLRPVGPRENPATMVSPIGDPFFRALNIAAMVQHPDAKMDTPSPPAKVLLVGTATAWQFIGDVEYATVFDVQPFAQVLSDPAQALGWLRERHIRYVVIDWREISRLAATYGFDPRITPEAVAKLAAAGVEDVHFSADNSVTVLRVPE
ncbi:MAG TPA: hypothetical protein VGN88_03445 [Phycisphaerae bacterium]|jgi:hypothetical protein